MVRGARRTTPVAEALTGGDDYELLFAVRPRTRGRLAAATRHGGVPLTRIGVLHGRARDRAASRGDVDGRPTARRCPRGLQPLPMIHLTRSAGPPLAGHAAAHRRHAGAHGGGVRARRVLRLLAVPRLAHAARRSSFAFLLNLNRVAVLLGVYSNLPWIIAPYYAFATMARRGDHRAPAAAGIPSAARRAVRAVAVQRRILAPADHDSETAALALHGRLDCRRARAGGVAYPLALAFVTSRRRIRTSCTIRSECTTRMQ